MKIIEPFSSDSYQSPEKHRSPWYDYLFLKSRFGFYLMFIFDVVIRLKNDVLAGIYDEERWAYSSRFILNRTEDFGAKYSISGMNHIKNVEGPVVFISNHMSTLETLIFPGLVVPPKSATFVVKESLTKGNYFGHIMRSRDPIAVKRKSAREDLTKVLTEGVEKLKKGISIIIFPQSTRSAVFDQTKFNSLGIKLAIRAGVPVIPVAVKTDFWGDSTIVRGFGPIRRKNTVHVEFAEAIHPKGRGKEEHQQIVDFITNRLKTWGAEVKE